LFNLYFIVQHNRTHYFKIKKENVLYELSHLPIWQKNLKVHNHNRSSNSSNKNKTKPTTATAAITKPN